MSTNVRLLCFYLLLLHSTLLYLYSTLLYPTLLDSTLLYSTSTLLYSALLGFTLRAEWAGAPDRTGPLGESMEDAPFFTPFHAFPLVLQGLLRAY